ncbi:MAG: FtsX-like permease family protein [Chloroflexota bacterium]|nr:FtsX-like permease family protein [Chloroflexota bacterium]
MSILLVLVMSFSFVNLIFTSSTISGVMHTMDEQIINTMFSNVVISPGENKYYIDHVSQMEQKIEQVPGVAGVAAHLNNSAFIEHKWKEKDSPTDKGKGGTWEVIGIDPGQEANVTTIHSQIVEGSYLDDGDRDEIVLGTEIAGGDSAQTEPFLTLGGVRIGDKVRLTYHNGVQREYTVKGIFRSRDLQADLLAFVTQKELASVMGRNVFYNRASQILVKAEPGVDENRLIEEFKALGIEGEIRSWQEYGGAIRGTISTFEIIGSLINAVGLIVAAIVMFIVIYINVISKRRQIGIMRAIGIARGTIIGSYLIQALFYAAFGVFLGWLAVRFLLLPYSVTNPLDLPIGLVSLTAQPLTMGTSTIGLILAAMLAGVVPAWAIMKQSIIKSIWGA